jgi:4-oxalomesaconate tautomerase
LHPDARRHVEGSLFSRKRSRERIRVARSRVAGGDGVPDALQIDGIAGADPLTSKVAIVSRSSRTGIDVDYLFAPVSVDRPLVDVTLNCGNMLAGVGGFAIERGLVAARDGVTPVAIYMLNTGNIAVAHIPTPCGEVLHEGSAAIAGVPGTAATI